MHNLHGRGAGVFVRLGALAMIMALGCGDDEPPPTDHPPTIDDASVTTPEDTPVAIALVAVDVDGDEVTIAVAPPSTGEVTVSGHTVTYTPAADFVGTVTLAATATAGGASDTATLTITVTPVNDPPVAVADVRAAAEDQPQSIPEAMLTANDTDADGDALTITAVTAPTGGTVALGSGTVEFTPAADFVGDATFTYTVSDGTDTDTATVTLQFGAANDPPVAGADTATTAEDTPLAIAAATLTANDTDPEGQTLAVTAVGGAVNGTVALAGGTVTFTPTADASGTGSFTYTVSDGVATATGTVTVTITAVNDPPVAVADARTTNEDTPLAITAASLTANDTDVDGGALTVTAVNGAVNGTVALAGGTVTFTPTANASGTGSFTYTVSDGAATATGTVTVTITAVNDPPVAVADARTTAEDTPLAITAASLAANDTDVDGGALTVTAVGGAVNGTVALAGGTVTFTPTANASGTGSFTYTVSDGTATATGTVTVAITAVNDPPVAVADARTTAEDTPLAITAASLTANDTDVDGGALTVTAVGGAVNGTVALAGGTVTFTPTANVSGTGSFTYTVSDGAATATGTVTVTITAVNDPPVAGADTATTAEDAPLAITAASLTANDTDVDGGALTVTAVGGAVNGTVALAGGTVTFTPTANASGTGSFTYTVSDGAATATGTVTVTITAVNDPPVAVADTATTAEDTPLAIAAASLTANDTDVDGGALTVTAVGGAVNGTVALAGGTVTFSPTANASGTGSFTYTVSDGAATATGTVTVTITAVNDPPVAVADTATTAEDTPLAITAASLTANDTDVDGGALTVTAVGGAVNGTVALAGGTVTFTPTANASGTGSFTYTVSDGAATATGTVTVTITAVNDPPVAVADARTTAEDTPLAITAASLTANDTDVDGGALTVTAVGGAVNGTVALAGGTVTFTPTANANGTGSFTYTVSDGTATATGTVTVTITAVNDPPVAVADTATTAEDTPLAIAAASLTANDTDVDGGALTVTAVGGAVNGTVAFAGGTVTFTPTANASGTGSFTYTVSDGAATATGTVTVTITAVNDPPVAVADARSTMQNTPLTITAASLIANDTDVDGGALTVTAVGGAANGTVALAGGTVTFTPTTGFSGTASFTYTVSDGAATATGTVTVTVSAAGAILQLSTGNAHICALANDGGVKCWGLNAYGNLGLGDTNKRGDQPNEMGVNLPEVDLGTGRTAVTLAGGGEHNCAILDDTTVKCWGYNSAGQLGLGFVASRGNGPGQMGDALPTVDLGTGRTAVQLDGGAEHTCAVLDNGALKCWGANDFGQLGLGDTAYRGDGPGEMGDALPAVDLGPGRTALQVSAGGFHTCALLDNLTVKCWGRNDRGQLGLGDTANRGDGPGEMGTSLPAVALGAGLTVDTLAMGELHACALFTNHTVKCWGFGAFGALGLGDVGDRGTGPGEMGASLPTIDLGTGRTALAIAVGHHTCALLDNLTVKCWGFGDFGQLGQGNTNWIGDSPGEMGDSLPAIAVGTGVTPDLMVAMLYDTCILTTNDLVKCWGGNLNGQLGQGDNIYRGDGPGEMGDALPYIDVW
jgi:alpha-tubulin suppressor-like RCC1 family protein